jgi:hypothetical protein
MDASDIWYVAYRQGQIGPLSLQELKEKLATVSNAGDVLVWRNGFPDWKRAQDVSELKGQTIEPPPLPTPGPTPTDTRTVSPMFSDDPKVGPLGRLGRVVFIASCIFATLVLLGTVLESGLNSLWQAIFISGFILLFGWGCRYVLVGR